MDRSSLLFLLIAVSEVIALLLIWRIWRSDDYFAMKIALSVLAVIPVVGTLGALWIHGLPPRQPLAIQNRYRYSTDVFTRWRHVFEEKDEKKRKRSITKLLEDGADDEGL